MFGKVLFSKGLFISVDRGIGIDFDYLKNPYRNAIETCSFTIFNVLIMSHISSGFLIGFIEKLFFVWGWGGG